MNRSRGPRLFGLSLRLSGTQARWVEIEQYPFVIGRAHDANLRLEAPGIWNVHLTLNLVPGEGLVAEPGNGALATLDAVPITRHRLRNGDLLTLGPAELQFTLVPVQRKPLGIWETAVWALWAGVATLQVILAWRLMLAS